MVKFGADAWLRVPMRVDACRCVPMRADAVDAVISHTATRCYAEHGIATASRLSVCLSVTLRYCDDHACWNTAKIILQLVSLGCRH